MRHASTLLLADLLITFQSACQGACHNAQHRLEGSVVDQPNPAAQQLLTPKSFSASFTCGLAFDLTFAFATQKG